MDRCLFNDLSYVILRASGKCCQLIDSKIPKKIMLSLQIAIVCVYAPLHDKWL